MAILPGKTTPDPQLTKTPPPPTVRPPVKVMPADASYTPQSGTGGTTPNSYTNASMGTSSTTDTPAATSPAQGDASTQGSDSVQAMLEATLRAIEAEYGLTQEQLLTDESDVGRQYRLLLAQSQRAGVQAQQQLQAGALDRGIVQSGIFADQAAKLQAQLSEQGAAYAADRDAQLARIAAERAALPAQQAAAEAAAAQQAAAAGLDLDIIKAMANGGV